MLSKYFRRDRPRTFVARWTRVRPVVAVDLLVGVQPRHVREAFVARVAKERPTGVIRARVRAAAAAATRVVVVTTVGTGPDRHLARRRHGVVLYTSKRRHRNYLVLSVHGFIVEENKSFVAFRILADIPSYREMLSLKPPSGRFSI